MENRNHEQPEKPENSNDFLPLDFDEAAKLMSGSSYAQAQDQAPAPAPAGLEVQTAFAAPPAPEMKSQEIVESLPTMPKPETAAPFPPPTSGSGFGRKPSRTLADDLSKSKTPLNISFGPALRQMRENRGVSLNEVADITKIRKDYLEALEAEDFSRLPPAVFVCGYVRKVCDLYNVPREVNDDIIKQLKGHADYRLGEENIDQMIEPDLEAGQEAEHRVRNIMRLAVFAVVFLAAVITAIVLLSISNKEKAPAEPKPMTGGPEVIASFNPASLEKLNPPQVIKMAELPLPEN